MLQRNETKTTSMFDRSKWSLSAMSSQTIKKNDKFRCRCLKALINSPSLPQIALLEVKAVVLDSLDRFLSSDEGLRVSLSSLLKERLGSFWSLYIHAGQACLSRQSNKGQRR
ncbi:hypothetical protein SERLADRAFT_404812 [Serpula lacrymans var. lacrymans S7.9]|uniref:Uncharacterized protein n=1 Tax=Serpula lacrymans var. lacrymans (strain S7.9) TaxID=578457 RepID=F8NF88_SERL9|nr:uncharacterized protein SERLADRAFT_404812 [Serpula lacrymans var. lacrymans S7.9]EGO30802.1 hypothetical protein SERLADRAFT_404812 [Serpula lacrymans var. lacrymans S7.9]